MIRLKDIAQRAGVSIMTVSKVLRDAPDISPATKARVRQLAEQMGYMPDSVAQGLRNRTTKLFGVVISATTNPVFARVLMAIEEKAYALGYDVILGHRAPFCDNFVNVESDDLAASYSGTKHLLELGHKRIAFFIGAPAAPSSHERLEGYRRALREAQIDSEDSLIFNAGS